VNDATSLGSSLLLSGTVDQVFVTSTHVLTTGYTNPGDPDPDEFRLYDESEGSITYRTDSDGDENLDLDYDGTSPALTLYPSSGFTGITTSNPDAELATAVIDISGGEDGLVYGDFSDLPANAEWYCYLYATEETILDGTFVDTSDDDTSYIYDNVRFFTGWNRVIQSTSDGSSFTYTAGDITDGHGTYMDNTN
jgi:hypothetical protein